MLGELKKFEKDALESKNQMEELKKTLETELANKEPNIKKVSDLKVKQAKDELTKEFEAV